MSGYAKGTWQISTYSNYNGWSIYADGCGCIAERWYNDAERSSEQNEEMKANALLMVVAPQLLDTLRGIANADWREWNEGLNTPEEFVRWAKSIAQAAINKAEGR